METTNVQTAARVAGTFGHNPETVRIALSLDRIRGRADRGVEAPTERSAFQFGARVHVTAASIPALGV